MASDYRAMPRIKRYRHEPCRPPIRISRENWGYPSTLTEPRGDSTRNAMPLEEREQRHVTAAQGFVELGMFVDADAELDRVDPFCRNLPEVLEVRARVYSALKRWELLEVVAKTTVG